MAKTRTSATGICSAAAFTLLELMVVLFVVSLVLAIAIPSFSVSSGKLKSEARKVSSMLRYMNETAAAKKETLSLKFDFKNGLIAWNDGAERKEKLESLVAVDLQSTGKVNEGELTVFFSPLGLREYMSVYLRRGEEEITVSFNPISGRTKIK